MKKRKWMKQLAVIVLAICMLAGVMPTGFEVLKPLEVEATCSAGVPVGNGTGGIDIQLNESPYKDMDYNNSAYSEAGCGWFATCRAKQITGNGSINVVNNGTGWMNSAAKKYGYTTGTDIKAPSLICWSGHIAVIEKIEGNTVYLSEGGSWYYSNAANGFCRIFTANINNVTGLNSGYLGCVYLSGASASISYTGTVTGVVADGVTNIGKQTATINAHAVIEGGLISANQMEVCFAIGEKKGVLGVKRGHYTQLSGGANRRIDFIYNTNDVRYPDLVLREGTRYWYQVYAKRLSDGVEFASEEQSFVTAIDFTPQNLGNSFYAYIKSKDSNMYISNPSVSSDSETSAQLKQKASAGTNNELWYFTKQNDGSYKIQSVFDSRTMVSWNGTVHAGYDEHYWYIQKDMDGYRLRQFEYAAYGLGVSSKTEGSAISFCDVKPSVESQIFDIQIVAPENVNFRPTAVTYTGGHVYEMYDSCVNWAQANAIAKKKGGHLVTITSSDEMDFLKSFMNNSQYSSSMYAGWWMGYTDVEKEGTWKWTTGETSSYTNWRSDQPDNARGNEDYAMLWGGNNFKWNDATGKEGYGFIVEYDNLQTMVPVQTMTYNGHRYELYDIPVNKGTAAGWANQKGGYLATITSGQEMEQISAMAKKSALYKNNLYGWYIGLGRTTTNAFVWNTGEVFSYKNWAPGEPNNGNNNENSAIIRGEDAATWNDVSSNSYFGFVVEYSEDWNPELKISAPEEVLPGETFDVSISVSANPVVVSAGINLVYDDSLLEVVPADFDGNGEVINGAIRNLNYKENTIRFAAADVHGIDWSNKVFTVTFRVKENVKRGTTLTFSTENIEQDMSALNGCIRPAGAVMASATVLVGPKYRLGDADGDGEITAKDALAILKHDVGIAQEVFDEEAADCDKDGEVTSKDALMVLKHDVGLLSLDELY